MDWDYAIERHRLPLLGHILGLFAMIGLTEGVTIERLSKPLYRQVLGILRTAESAVRRLIYVAARDIVVEPRPERPARAKRQSSSESKDKGQENREGRAKRKRGFLFRLFDPPKRFKRSSGRRHKPRQQEPHVRGTFDPRIPWFLRGQPAPPPPPPVVEEEVIVDDDTVNAGPLIRRLFAIVDALQDIPRQAMRLALWRAPPIEERHPPRSSPLRTGRPPGYRKRNKHQVDEILKECQWLARNVQPQLDTS